MNFDAQWDRTVLLELTQEYSRTCRDRKLKLRPISIQLFDSLSLWGQYDSLSRTIFISRKLVQKYSWQEVLGVFKHEMAHQYVYETSGAEYLDKPHGETFQKACRILGVPSQFMKAKVGLQEAPLSWKDEPSETAEEKMIDKVKKLLALAQSANEHEAGLAMKKVQQLYAQYNLDRASISDRNQYVHLIISLKKKRKNAWEQRIISILLEFFFVEIIVLQEFNPTNGEKEQAFEIIGTRENVLMAEYVYFFLMNQVESLCQKNSELVQSQKSSFRLGVLEGFSEKLKDKDSLGESSAIIQKALVKFKSDPQLKGYLKEIYPRLTTSRNSARMIDTNAFQAGHHVGRKLALKKPIESSQKSSLFLTRTGFK